MRSEIIFLPWINLKKTYAMLFKGTEGVQEPIKVQCYQMNEKKSCFLLKLKQGLKNKQ